MEHRLKLFNEHYEKTGEMLDHPYTKDEIRSLSQYQEHKIQQRIDEEL